MTRYQKFWILAIAAFSFLAMTCRKNIAIPKNTDFEKLFGSWNWVQSSGGFAGQIITPTTEGYSQTVEFKKNGVYIRYKNGKRTDKMQFTLTEGSSIYTTGLAHLIKYKNTGPIDKDNTHMTQSVTFGGQDTLFLRDECYDCYTTIYIKRK